MKTKTNVGVMKEKYRQNQLQILECTGVSEDDYSLLLFNTACDWIRARILDNDDVLSKITTQELFWSWWINQWNLREDAFITEYLEYFLSTGFQSFLYPVWLKIHEVDRISVIVPESVMKEAIRCIELEQRMEVKHA